MEKNRLFHLVETWAQAKKVEAQSIKTRREVEDEISKICAIDPKHEGTVSLEIEQYKVKIESKFTRKVNADNLQEIAGESGLTDHLFTLFRWKPEIEMKAWKAADPAVTNVLLKAVTTTASRPSYSISQEE
tara:strand:+ start:5235 stop:5627 length:393 start_codon:yes stop_codon:yes gene_type:complete